MIGGLESPPVAVRTCTAAELAALTENTDEPYRLTCRAALDSSVRVVRPLVIEGSEASGAGIDCAGGRIGREDRPSDTLRPTIAIQSRPDDAAWSRPTDIGFSRCTVYGNIRIWGLGAEGDVETLRRFSRQADFTRLAQAAAPSGVTLRDVNLVGTGSIPLYLGPGVTRVTMQGGGVSGRSVSTAVYLDSESAGTVIHNVRFDIRTRREQIAIDGSAHNTIQANTFNLRWRGGIFLYRNCGERGVVRHQTPSYNIIDGNRFFKARWVLPRSVVVGARGGRQSYCAADAGWPFGSSQDDGDHATANRVVDNRVSWRWAPF